MRRLRWLSTSPSMSRLVILMALAMALAFALPDTTEATTFDEVKKLTASDGQVGDDFGVSVAVSGDIAVVGANLEDAAGSDAGAAYVFQRNEGGADNWGELKKLTASDAEAYDYFGYSVAVSGETAVVGAWVEDSGGSFAGAAYVFQRNEGGVDNWGEVKKLTASDAEASDQFGASVAVDGDTAVVGAIGEGAGGSFAVAAYVFQRDDGGADNWGEVKKLTASNAEAEDFFGASVAVSGATTVVGAVGEDAGASFAGAVYVYQRDEGGAGNWGEVTKVTGGSRGNDGFGRVVAVDGDTVVAGATSRGRAPYHGAAYLFDLGPNRRLRLLR